MQRLSNKFENVDSTKNDASWLTFSKRASCQYCSSKNSDLQMVTYHMKSLQVISYLLSESTAPFLYPQLPIPNQVFFDSNFTLASVWIFPCKTKYLMASCNICNYSCTKMGASDPSAILAPQTSRFFLDSQLIKPPYKENPTLWPDKYSKKIQLWGLLQSK